MGNVRTKKEIHNFENREEDTSSLLEKTKQVSRMKSISINNCSCKQKIPLNLQLT